MTSAVTYIGGDDDARAADRIAFAERVLSGQRQKLPAFWPNALMRRFLIAERGFVTLDMAHKRMVAEHGPHQAPSRSAIHRFWMLLDRLERTR